MNKERLRKLFAKSSWDEETILEADKIIERIARDYLGLDTYPNQFEIVTSEQMLDAYALTGLPLSYNHWKFGKDFVINHKNYKKGRMGLAYELVINSNPCISYNMEDNTTCLTLLVLAHASYGHNHFFKNNYLFKQWTNADAIIDYMKFAKNYIAACEERYGYEEVELILDAAHALMNYGVDKYKKPSKLKLKEENQRLQAKMIDDRIILSDIWSVSRNENKVVFNSGRYPEQPEENILYFIEKNSPILKEWQREIIRIVRKIAQYFYPQGQTKVINEGCATFTHYEIIHQMYEEGYLDEGFMMEFLHHHSNVIYQPDYDAKYYSGINPYTLGYYIFSDLKRMALDPTEEDKIWFPEIAGNTDWQGTFRSIVENYKDDSFIQQYLSPKVIRDLKLFVVDDQINNNQYEISAIHDEMGYKQIRKELAIHYNRAHYIPDIQVFQVDYQGDRSLTLDYTNGDMMQLNNHNTEDVLRYLKLLWGFPIRLISNGDINNLLYQIDY